MKTDEGLGKPKTKKSNALAIHLDQDGKVKYDTLGKSLYTLFKT